MHAPLSLPGQGKTLLLLLAVLVVLLGVKETAVLLRVAAQG
jgi:hypothetical protein